ncbi:hypothetical protein HanXRQr2_Chr05g0195411 [Helianthus annuus]|uniref:Uncharacterized protein n=2 Tax=Helianthus annuus TaxID=4232 RepID=A0A9K3NKT7_HELAN|nr:hypothetical protein HanXRQr2_Chr05g0195411 [Helianthus annuus]KAJ0583231.1 hypothetical protein HanHA89_Chr05g0174271 [Helianthus annuus]KAJ0745968.1 hypothetical protein HanOQP8_Chr05g0172191 [Helianthus annuus]KAJ0921219.1 hypothetical protein HanPSC8_Chr05g0189001 [Helianthus annuus]
MSIKLHTTDLTVTLCETRFNSSEMDPEPNSDNEEKKDPKITEDMKEKAKGKRPMTRSSSKQVEMDSETALNLALITQKAQGIVIDEARVLRSKGNAPAVGVGSKKSKGKQLENVAKGSYYLRSSRKGMDIDGKPPKAKTVSGKKRKGGERKRLQSPETDTEEMCKRIKRKRDRDDDADDMDATPARMTRSSSKLRRVNSL